MSRSKSLKAVEAQTPVEAAIPDLPPVETKVTSKQDRKPKAVVELPDGTVREDW